MKKILSVTLALMMVITMIPMAGFAAFAADKDAEIIDIDIYKAKCLSGIADDPDSNAVNQCNMLYNYYVNENIYSPTQSFLDSCYEDKGLMKKYDAWQAYSLAADPSSAVDLVMTKENYYQTLIIAMYQKAFTENNKLQDIFKNKVLNTSNKLIGIMCELKQITEVSEIVQAVDLHDPTTITAINDCVKATYSMATASKISSVVGDVVEYGTDILDVMDKLAAYGEMAELDDSTKIWLNQMYDSCTSDTDIQLRSALKTLKMASTDFAGAVLADIKTTAFTLTRWIIKETWNTGVATLSAVNPVVAAIFSGLKIGKSVCNIFFSSDDICEQLFTMECIYDVQDLSRRVAESCKSTFVNEQSKNNAIAFNYAVDCYYESIINIDITCMEDFLDELYNGGVLKGCIKWIYGATYDYQCCINSLEDLKSSRQNNYNNMIDYFKAALAIYYPDTFDLYFNEESKVDIESISFFLSYIKPLGYPSDDGADLYVGDFCNAGVSFTPSDTTQTGYTLTSSNTDVLQIKDNCILAAVSEGTSTVTVTSVDNPRVFYTREIVIKNKPADVEEDNVIVPFTYTVGNNKATITGLIDGYNPTALKIPSKIGGYPVTRIGDSAFKNCTSLTSVTMPDSIVSIGDYAFSGCTSLTNIKIPDCVVSIGNSVFSNCTALQELTMPCSVEFEKDSFLDCYNIKKVTLTKGTGKIPGFYANIINSSSDNCAPWSINNKSLKKIIVEDGVTSIGDFAFVNCNAKSIELPNSITEISLGAFTGCKNLTDFIIPDGVTSIGRNTFSRCSSLTSVTIPNSVTSIGGNAFYGCTSLTSVTIGNGVTSIGDGAFSGCSSLTSVTIPDSVTYIDRDAFEDCTLLTSVTIGNSVKSIGGNAFYGCSSLEDIYYTGDVAGWMAIAFGGNPLENGADLYIQNDLLTDLVIPNGITDIGHGAFKGCTSLTSVTIPNSVTSIGSSAFDDCTSLTSVTIGNGVTSIGSSAFDDCTSLTSVTIGNGVTSIGNGAFSGCSSLTSVTIPDSVTYIDRDAFEDCTLLTSVTIGNSVTSIDNFAFSGCSSLTSVTIPNSVKSIGDYAFSCCNSLEDVYYTGDVAGWMAIAFGNYDSNPLYYGADLYIQNELLTDLVIPNGITDIGDGVFSGCSSLTSVTIPNSVTSIGSSAFDDCTSLTSVTIPNSVKSIGGNAFSGCSSLEDVYYTGDVADWMAIAFGDYYSNPLCNGADLYIQNKLLTDLVIPNGITDIGDAFEDCTSLTSVTIPDSVTSIDSYAFDGCTNLTTIYGYKNTAAESYAAENGFKFVDLLDSIKIEEPQGGENGVIKIDSKDITVGDIVTKLLDSANGGAQTFAITENRVTVYDENKNVITDMSVKAKKGMTFKLEKTDGTTAVYDLAVPAASGDIDGNGEVDDWDSVLLDRYLAGWEVTIDTSAADMDENGIIDDWDSVLLARSLAGWNDQ